VPNDDEVKYLLAIRKKALEALERKHELTERSRLSRLDQEQHRQKIIAKALNRAQMESDQSEEAQYSFV